MLPRTVLLQLETYSAVAPFGHLFRCLRFSISARKQRLLFRYATNIPLAGATMTASHAEPVASSAPNSASMAGEAASILFVWATDIPQTRCGLWRCYSYSVVGVATSESIKITRTGTAGKVLFSLSMSYTSCSP
jgi:hypothetical protein